MYSCRSGHGVEMVYCEPSEELPGLKNGWKFLYQASRMPRFSRKGLLYVVCYVTTDVRSKHVGKCAHNVIILARPIEFRF